MEDCDFKMLQEKIRCFLTLPLNFTIFFIYLFVSLLKLIQVGSMFNKNKFYLIYLLPVILYNVVCCTAITDRQSYRNLSMRYFKTFVFNFFFIHGNLVSPYRLCFLLKNYYRKRACKIVASDKLLAIVC